MQRREACFLVVMISSWIAKSDKDLIEIKNSTTVNKSSRSYGGTEANSS